jgi:proprotein convertase subtilisin/kexin type 5
MYADYTNVSCQACNNICKTCINNSLNCLSCNINAFLFNNTCLNKCPTGYYGNNSLCVICTSAVPSCSTPLTF